MVGGPGLGDEPGACMEVWIDGTSVLLEPGASLLDACDAAGHYVPRLCYFPGLGCAGSAGGALPECGLCCVRLGDGALRLACCTSASAGDRVTTDDAGLHSTRLERLASILTGHPHVCPSCPDRDGCNRDECTYGIPIEARCCEESGRCELGRLVAYLDADRTLTRPAVSVERIATEEGRIRSEPGLCVGCGRCVRICAQSPQAGLVLGMVPANPLPATEDGSDHSSPGAVRWVALPKQGGLRESGCTFCGLCVMVCPAGALTAPGEAGARWLAGRRAAHGPASPVLPPETRSLAIPDDLPVVPKTAGLFRLLDKSGQVLLISGVADLEAGLRAALAEQVAATAAFFQFEIEPLYTQRETELLALYVREHGRLPPGNDLGDELFEEDLLGDDLGGP